MVLGSLSIPGGQFRDAPGNGQTVPFVQNQGQWNEQVRFVARLGSTVIRAERGALLIQRHSGARGHLMRLDLGAEVEPRGEGKLNGKFSFFVGDDESQWRGGVPAYESVVYRGLRPGVDLAVEARGGRVQIELRGEELGTVVPLMLESEGESELSHESDGGVTVKTSSGAVSLAAPRIKLGKGRVIGAEIRKTADGSLSFVSSGVVAESRLEQGSTQIGSDLVWSTYVGASFGFSDSAWDSVLDARGNLYVSGQTEGLDFPTTPGAFVVQGHDRDVVVLKLDAKGKELIYSAIIGGNADEAGYGIALCPTGDVVVAGYTFSKDFPTTEQAFDKSHDAFNMTGFVASLDPNGAQLAFSTFLGGSVAERIRDIDLLPDGDIAAVGYTGSADLPATQSAYQRSYQGVQDAFVARISGDGSKLRWLSYLGGGSPDDAEGVAIGIDGSLTIAGWTGSDDFPTTPGSFDTSFNGNGSSRNCFITRLTGAGSLVWSTYLGAPGASFAREIEVNPWGDVWVAGTTNAAGFPVTAGAFDSQFNNGLSLVEDAFLARLDSGGNTLVFATFLGELGPDFASGLRIDPSGVATLVGWSFQMPTTKGAWSESPLGADDLFVSRLDPYGKRLLYSTMLGGSNSDFGRTLSLEGTGRATVLGSSVSSDFPTTPGAFDTSYNGGQTDIVATRMSLLPTGVLRYGSSAPTCLGPMALGVLEMPEAGGGGFGFYLSTAPPSSSGAVALSLAPAATAIPLAGVDVWIRPGSIFAMLPAVSDVSGYGEVLLPLPTGTAGFTLYAQAVFNDTAACGAAGTLSGSNALGLTIQ